MSPGAVTDRWTRDDRGDAADVEARPPITVVASTSTSVGIAATRAFGERGRVVRPAHSVRRFRREDGSRQTRRRRPKSTQGGEESIPSRAARSLERSRDTLHASPCACKQQKRDFRVDRSWRREGPQPRKSPCSPPAFFLSCDTRGHRPEDDLLPTRRTQLDLGLNLPRPLRS